MRRTIRAVSVIALSAVALAPLPGPSATGAPAAVTPGWIDGTVVDGNGDPVVGALVNVLDPVTVPEGGLADDLVDRRVLTDAEGDFRVRQAPDGSLVQICTPEPGAETSCKETTRGVDFVNTYVGGSGVTDSWITQRSLLPTTAGDRDLGEVTVKPEGRINGTVQGATEGTAVRVMRLNDTPAFSTWTDAAGAYAFDGLVPGDYYIATGGAGTLAWRSPTFTLQADQDKVVNATLSPGVALTGLVRATGKPVPGIELLVRRNGRPFAGTATDATGRYRVSGLTPATYTVENLYGGRYLVAKRKLTVTTTTGTVSAGLPVRKGAEIRVRVVGEAKPFLVRDELRNANNTPVQANANNGKGFISYWGLPRGRYTVAVGGAKGYRLRTVKVTALRTYRLGAVRATEPYVTVRGTTRPKAVVEATTGDFCPPESEPRYGGVHEIVVANARGEYRIPKLIPGRYMLGVDPWPSNGVPRCDSGVRLWHSKKVNLPLGNGAKATGRLVYADTGTPVITELSYELRFAPGSVRNPTGEHPARAKARGATGRFTIDRMRTGTAKAFLAADAGEEFTDGSFLVIYPFQDGTPYWLEAVPRSVKVTAGRTTNLGDIEVVQH